MTEPTLFLRLNRATTRFTHWLPICVSGVLGSILAWPLLVAFPINGGDALWVSQSARALVGCARQGDWSGCPGTYQFGLIQHAPAFFLTWRGLGDDSVVFVLTLINLAAFVWLMIRGVQFFGGNTRSAWIFLLAFAVGPIYAYSVYSFSEILVLTITIALIMSIVESRKALSIFALTFIVVSSRETAFTVVLPIAIASSMIFHEAWRARLRRLAPVIAGTVIGLGAVFWFNYWKFGTISNPVYSDPIRRVPGLALKIKNALAIWISPTGGVGPVWILGAVLALVLPVIALLKHRTHPRRALAPGILLLAPIGQTILLASWFAPFGWVAWGPRLILPTVASCAFLSIILFKEEISDWIARLRWRLLPILWLLVVFVLSTFPNLGFILDRNAIANWFSPPGPPLLPGCAEPANIEINKQQYLDCGLDFAPWQLGKTLWDVGLKQVGTGWAMIAGGFVLSLVWGLAWSRQEAATADRSSLDD